MFILVVVPRTGTPIYYGPFKSKARAEEYALSLPTDIPVKWKAEEIITPYRD